MQYWTKCSPSNRNNSDINIYVDSDTGLALHSEGPPPPQAKL